jgi:peptidoglycan/LPS O-acetylase OafA/YrhL
LKYRADIDGLRAFAVVPVVLFHAGVAGFGGGYVGVDVFFVISGYLITLLIVSESDKAGGKFSIAWFYERRIRRIFPALFVIIVFCLIAGWFVLAPNDYKSLGGSIFATSLFISNILFWLRSGYFEIAADQQPLLHTWSLAVEEQFYLLYPLLLVILLKKPDRIPRIIGVLALVSFTLSAAFVFFYPGATFYLSPFRFWELLIGALLAIKCFPIKTGARSSEVLSWIGLAMILVPVICYSKETIFPGLTAAIPVGGAAILIYVGEPGSNSVSRLMSLRPFVFIGQISYSLYLWHFVLITFGRYLSIDRLTAVSVGVLILMSTVIAILSWRFVELPVRRTRSIALEGSSLFGIGALVTIFLAATGLAIRSTDGFATRLTPEQLRVLETKGPNDGSLCGLVTLNKAASKEFCRIGVRDGVNPSFFVWGDSHGIAFWPAFKDLAKKRNTNGLLAAVGGCPPVVGVRRMEPEYRDCEIISRQVLSFIVSNNAIRTVILVSRWAYFVEGKIYNDEPTDRYRTKHALVASTLTPKQHDTVIIMADGLEQTVAQLKTAGKDVWIVGPVPEVGIDVPKSLFLKALGLAKEIEIAPSREKFEQRQKNVRQLLDKIAAEYRINVVWPGDVLCRDVYCKIEVNGSPVYQDDNHLSYYGAIFVDSVIEKINIR